MNSWGETPVPRRYFWHLVTCETGCYRRRAGRTAGCKLRHGPGCLGRGVRLFVEHLVDSEEGFLDGELPTPLDVHLAVMPGVVLQSLATADDLQVGLLETGVLVLFEQVS